MTTNESLLSMDIKQDLISLFRQNTGDLESVSGTQYSIHTGTGLQGFQRLGIPTIKNEAYKYTPIDKYMQGNYDVELKPILSR